MLVVCSRTKKYRVHGHSFWRTALPEVTVASFATNFGICSFQRIPRKALQARARVSAYIYHPNLVVLSLALKAFRSRRMPVSLTSVTAP